MYSSTNRRAVRKRVRRRIRRKVAGTGGRPRLAVFRSLKHIYAQAIDDERGVTLAQASTRGASGGGSNVEAARQVGTQIASKLKDAGVTTVVFDRGGFLYHGRVRAVADAAREAGLKL